MVTFRSVALTFPLLGLPVNYSGPLINRDTLVTVFFCLDVLLYRTVKNGSTR